MDYFAFAGVAVAAEDRIKGNNIGLNGEVVLTTTKKEIAIHAPILVIRVPHDPVFSLRLVVKAPPDEHDRVVLVLPGEAAGLHGLLAWELFGFELLLAHAAVAIVWFCPTILLQRRGLLVNVRVGLDEDSVDEGAQRRDALVVVETESLEVQSLLCDALLGQNTAVVSLEQLVGLEFDGDGTVSEHFFEDLVLGDFAPALADVFGVQDFGRWLAVFIVGAFLPLGHALIRRALVGDHVAALHEVSVHVGPAALATLVEKVALHDLLGGDHWNLLSVLQFQPGFGSLYEGDGVA